MMHFPEKTNKPKDIPQLRSFLGLVHYYQQFLPNLATKLHPLYGLYTQEQYTLQMVKGMRYCISKIKTGTDQY